MSYRLASISSAMLIAITRSIWLLLKMTRPDTGSGFGGAAGVVGEPTVGDEVFGDFAEFLVGRWIALSSGSPT